MILSNESSTTACQAGAPVFGGIDFFQLVSLADVGETLVN
jgi:hypothetical protein